MNDVTLAYVVYYKGKPLAVYLEADDAKWCAFMLGRHSKVKKFTSRVLLKILK